MGEFDNRIMMNDYYYELFCTLSDNRMFLSKKILSEIEKDIYSEYCLSNKLLIFNEKFNLKIEFKKLMLERKQKKKEFKFYRKQFTEEYVKKLPVIYVSVDVDVIKLSTNTLPKLRYISDVKGSIKWKTHILEPGKNFYDWEFVPKDKSYSKREGSIMLFVINDIDDNESE